MHTFWIVMCGVLSFWAGWLNGRRFATLRMFKNLSDMLGVEPQMVATKIVQFRAAELDQQLCAKIQAQESFESGLVPKETL